MDKKNPTPEISDTIYLKCDETECTLSLGVSIGAATVIFLLVLTILILSICLCRVCRKLKKRKLTEGMDKEDVEEADLHYAELQNLPVSSREQCNGGTCTAALAVAPNNDYATVAELKGPQEEGIDQEPNQDNGGDDGVEENQPCVEME
nr:leukocyte-specific transcript 1 protein [Pogona vitticeps]